MLRLENDVLHIDLPSGKTQQELLLLMEEALKPLEKELYGKDIKIEGRITTAMCLSLGHKLAHITRSVSIFDPKENAYVLAIRH